MTHRAVGEAKAVDVILSEAKNLVHIRGGASMPRSFATLRMTGRAPDFCCAVGYECWRIHTRRVQRCSRCSMGYD